jgi:MFS family permease
MACLTQIWARTFDALADRNFRWFWMGRMATMAGFQMMLVARGWLVYELTGSALVLGAVNTSRMITLFAFSPLGGVVADRVNKRDLMAIGRVIEGLNLLVIGVLITSGHILVWHLIVGQVLAGIMLSLLLPTREALLAELVDRRVLLNAQALHSFVIALTGIMASILGGLLIAAAGVGTVYYLSVLCYVGNFVAYLQLPSTPGRGAHFSLQQAGRDLLEGLRYIWRNPHIKTLLGTRLTRALLATPYRTFLPVFAAEVFGVGPAGLGLLSGMSRIGGAVGALVMAYLGDLRGKGQFLLATGMATGVALVLFARVPLFYVAVFILLLIGIIESMGTVTFRTLMQTAAERQVRWRIMSASAMVWGLSSLGELPAGAIADAVSAPFAVILLGVLLALAFLILFLRRPDFRRLE